MADERSGMMLFAAGFAGSLASALHKQKSVRDAVIHMIGGTASAGFLTPLMFEITGIDASPNLQSAMAFLMGVIGMRVVDLIVEKFFPDSQSLGDDATDR
jgi:uncharacterized membrane protein YeaQ/YmgE (transglycosylase-associated protein family)